MNHFIIILYFSIIYLSVYAQSAKDTLAFRMENAIHQTDYIKCYSLNPLKPFFEQPEYASEYEKLERTNQIYFKNYTPYIFRITQKFLEISTSIIHLDSNEYNTNEKKITINNILDTIILEKAGRIQPIIISNNHEYAFYGANIHRIKDETMLEYSIYSEEIPLMIEFSSDALHNNNDLNEKGTYYISDLYYRKGVSTYYLNRSIVIIIK